MVITESAELFLILQEPLKLTKNHLLQRFIATDPMEPLKRRAEEELARIEVWKNGVIDSFFA